MYKNILIATDGSALASRAIEHGTRLAQAVGARVVFLTVSESFHLFSLTPSQVEETPDSLKSYLEKRADQALSEAARKAAEFDVTALTLHVEDDDPYRAIIRTAEDRACDLIVMASHGRGRVSALFLGSETMKVLSHSPVPVLVVR